MIVPKSEHSKMAKRVVPKAQKSAITYASQRRIEVMTGMLNSPISWRWELGQLSECDEARGVTFRAAMHEGGCSLLRPFSSYLLITFVVSLSYVCILLWKHRESCFITEF